MTTATTNRSITGRDGYIMAQALYWAIKFSQRLPSRYREWSNEQDMKAILNSRFPDCAELLLASDTFALRHLRNPKASGHPGRLRLDWSRAEIETAITHHTPPDLRDEKRVPDEDDEGAGFLAAESAHNSDVAFVSGHPTTEAEVLARVSRNLDASHKMNGPMNTCSQRS